MADSGRLASVAQQVTEFARIPYGPVRLAHAAVVGRHLRRLVYDLDAVFDAGGMKCSPGAVEAHW
jgi:hypothetical protein